MKHKKYSGSWLSTRDRLRACFRSWSLADNTFSNFSLRLACNHTPELAGVFGHSWLQDITSIPELRRGRNYPDTSVTNIGFRVACAVSCVRVLRGGGWGSLPGSLRVSLHGMYEPDCRFIRHEGFRVACEVLG